MIDQERFAELETEKGRLHEQTSALRECVRDLAARLAEAFQNSSKQPSSDGLKRQLPNTRSLRHKTGKQSGGQLWYPGEYGRPRAASAAPWTASPIASDAPPVTMRSITPTHAWSGQVLAGGYIDEAHFDAEVSSGHLVNTFVARAIS